jgi:hypothetical protein
MYPCHAFGKKLIWFESRYRHYSLCCPVMSSKKNTLVPVPLSAYFICRQVRSSETNYVCSNLAFGIFLYVAHSGLRKRTTLARVPLSACFYMNPIRAFGNELRWFESRHRPISIWIPVRPSETNYVCSSPANRPISLWIPVKFAETNCFCSSAAIGIFLYVAQSGLRKRTTLVRVPLLAYFYM